MTESFEIQLARVAGTIHAVYMDDHHHRMENSLLYYLNKADNLRRSTEIILSAGGPRDTSSMLGGMSLEVLLKGIARGLANPPKILHHSLAKLVDHVGIEITIDERVLLDVMSEHVYWAGRYPAPRNAKDWGKVWELQDKQQKRSGSLADIEIPSRTISIGTFRQLWMKFANYFDRVQQSRYESAEFTYEKEHR